MVKFIYSLRPLLEAGKLGAVLLQFPVFFYPSKKADDYMCECREVFGKIPLVVEFRNRGWSHPPTFEFLKKHSLAYCAVDEPHLPRLMPFIDEVTSDIAYVFFNNCHAAYAAKNAITFRHLLGLKPATRLLV